MGKPGTVRELRASGYRSRSVKEEMRHNLIGRIQAGEPLFPGIVGYEQTVIPLVQNAILSGQDLILLGERGQAKTRIARGLVDLLDEEVPYIAGCEVNDDPYRPICAACREKVACMGEDTPIEWLVREQRYGEKLATPDITIADLIGEIDPIRVAEGRYLSDELTIHFGLIPRTNRGIFCINELPDLAERIQVGLFNIMEERDVQIRGYKVRLALDLYMVASANPEDYTNRGRIITPLKDRFGSQVRTHYPQQVQQEIDIMEAERTEFDAEGYRILVPQYMKEIVAQISHFARETPDISQRSGVSVRVSICNYENLVSNALRRAVHLSEQVVVPRVSDLPALVASTAGKIELEALEDADGEKIVQRLCQKAVQAVFNRYFAVGDFEQTLRQFDAGLVVEVSDAMPSRAYQQQISRAPGLSAAFSRLGIGKEPAEVAAAVEFILEGLHTNRKLNKDRSTESAVYRS